MNKITETNKLYVAESHIPNSGRGVFANTDIKNGELIERCPLIELPEYDEANLKETILVTYFFYFGEKKERAAIALGYGAIYNHTRTPNATYKINGDEGVIDFIATSDIKKDEEITVNYNHANPDDKFPMWFE